MIEVQLRGLEFFLTQQLCSPQGTTVELHHISAGKAEIVCQYEGYARILEGLLCKQKNIAEMGRVGYSELLIKFGGRVIAIAEAFDLP